MGPLFIGIISFNGKRLYSAQNLFEATQYYDNIKIKGKVYITFPSMEYSLTAFSKGFINAKFP